MPVHYVTIIVEKSTCDIYTYVDASDSEIEAKIEELGGKDAVSKETVIVDAF